MERGAQVRAVRRQAGTAHNHACSKREIAGRKLRSPHQVVVGADEDAQHIVATAAGAEEAGH